MLHDDGGKCYRAVIIQTGDGRFIWYGDNGGLFEAGGDCRLVQREVENRGEYLALLPSAVVRYSHPGPQLASL